MKSCALAAGQSLDGAVGAIGESIPGERPHTPLCHEVVVAEYVDRCSAAELGHVVGLMEQPSPDAGSEPECPSMGNHMTSEEAE